MCGIYGVVGSAAETVDISEPARALAHRGRDHAAHVVGPGYALGYCRLAIRGVGDHEATGHQPFVAGGLDWVGFGVGEIYNADEVRARHRAAVAPEGDIGAVLAGYLGGGLDGLRDLTGEFAFALYDRDHRRLLLGRDLVGTRGLFVATRGSSLLFASEVKGLAAMGVPLRADPLTVASYLRFNYPLAPHTWYDGISAVPPGGVLEWSDGRTRVDSFADIGDLAAAELESAAPLDGSEIRELVRSAVLDRTQSDVRLGQHLSGGVDSSTIAHVAAAADPRAYTLEYAAGTRGRDRDGDGQWAEEVARATDLEWCFLAVSPDEALARVPDTIAALDGPLMSPGALTPYFVARAAALDGISVLLQGQGADEVFLGYERFRVALAQHDPDIAELAANVDRGDIAPVCAPWVPAIMEAERVVRQGGELPGGGEAAPLLGLQVAYIRYFLHELLRIEDHVHLAWTVENRPALLDARVVRAGLGLTVHDPRAALGKPVLRELLAEYDSPAARRAVKQQMTLPLPRVADWAVGVLGEPAMVEALPFLSRAALSELGASATTTSRQRLLWALANLGLWATSQGIAL